MSRGSHPQLSLDHQALARDLVANYNLLLEQSHGESPDAQLRWFCLHLGYHLEHICKRQLGVRQFTREQFAAVAAELVRVFGGECEVLSSGGSPMVLQARAWEAPPEAQDGPHPSELVPEILAEVAARNFGYGKVSLRRQPAGVYELRAYLKESRHARLHDGVECTPETLPDPGELQHELLHQAQRVRALRDALRNTEQRFTALAEQAPDAILSLDPQGRCTYANEAAGRLLGYEPPELVGMALADLVAPESAEAAKAQFDRAFQGEPTDLFRMSLVRRSGEHRHVSVRAWPRRTSGRIAGVDALARDITHREQADRALARSEARYRTLVEVSPDSIFTLGPEGHITFMNQHALDAMGYAESDLMGAHFGRFLAPESRESGQAMFLRAIAPEADPTLYQLHLVAKDGRVIDVDISVSQMREDGRVVGLLGIARDMTQRRQIQQELFQQHRVLSALNAISNAVSRSLDLRRTVDDALERVLAVTEFEGAAAWLLEPEAGLLRLVASRGLPQDMVEQVAVMDVNEATCGAAVISGEPLVADDLGAYTGQKTRSLMAAGAQSLVAVPLVAQQQVVGVMCLGAREKVAVSPETLDLLVGVGNQVGMGVQNAQLFETTQEQARTDFLTGLYNRQYLQEVFEREVERAKRYHHPVAVLMLDLDGLKAINDSLGHRVGDEALCVLAEALRASVRACDIAARFGGDEFVVVMPETDEAGAEACGKRINERLAELSESSSLPLRLSASIGVAASDSEFKHLLDEADRAMYTSRRRRPRRATAAASR